MTKVELIDQGIIQGLSRQKVSNAGSRLIIGEQISGRQATLLLVDSLLTLK